MMAARPQTVAHPRLSLSELRAETQRWPADNGLYRLCLDVPPLDPRRQPPNLRWLLYGGQHYAATARAYAQGRAGVPLDDADAHLIWRAAWLAGLDAAASERKAP